MTSKWLLQSCSAVTHVHKQHLAFVFRDCSQLRGLKIIYCTFNNKIRALFLWFCFFFFFLVEERIARGRHVITVPCQIENPRFVVCSWFNWTSDMTLIFLFIWLINTSLFLLKLLMKGEQSGPLKNFNWYFLNVTLCVQIELNSWVHPLPSAALAGERLAARSTVSCSICPASSGSHSDLWLFKRQIFSWVMWPADDVMTPWLRRPHIWHCGWLFRQCPHSLPGEWRLCAQRQASGVGQCPEAGGAGKVEPSVLL